MKLFDPVREKWVAKTPEELVRQRWISELLSLGYPRSNLVVERSLQTLPPLAGYCPDRRIDLLAFRLRGERFEPLILGEFKAKPLQQADWNQLLGYNCYLQAAVVLLANTEGFWCVRHDKQGYQTLQAVPSFTEWDDCYQGQGFS